MKPIWTVMLVAAWLLTPAVTQVQAQEQERPGRGGRQRMGGDRSRPPNRQDALIERLRTSLDLDKEQMEKFDQLAAEFRKAGREAVRPDEQRKLVDELHEASRAGDRERVEEIRKELQELRGPDPAQGFLDQVDGILRDDQKEKLAKIRERMASRGGRGRQQPLAQLRALKGRLELSDEQAKQYDELFRELRSKLRPGRPVESEADAEFLQKLREAVDSGDEERIRELSEEMQARRQEAGSQSEDAIDEFFNAVEEILDPSQVKILSDFREEMESRGRGGRADLRACFRYVRRLDLDRDQREAVRDLSDEAFAAEREARRDREQRARVTAEYQEKLRDLLTDDQVAKFDRWLESQQSDRHGRGGRGDRPPRGERGRRGGNEQP